MNKITPYGGRGFHKWQYEQVQWPEYGCEETDKSLSWWQVFLAVLLYLTIMVILFPVMLVAITFMATWDWLQSK